MRKVCSSLLVLTLLLAAATAAAQSLSRFKQRLAEPAGTNGATVTVTESGDAASAVERAARGSSRKSFRGYRVCIFFDNSPNARAEATKARELFEENYPDAKVYMTYDNPYWRVTAGNCLTAEEAIILKGRVIALFPKAFVKNEELTLADLIQETK